MVLTKGQQAGDVSPANVNQVLVTTGGETLALLGSGASQCGCHRCRWLRHRCRWLSSKAATGGLLSSRPDGAIAGTSSFEASVHSPTSDGALPVTTVVSYDASTSPMSQETFENTSPNPIHLCGWGPSVTGPGGFFGNAASVNPGAYFGPTDRALIVPPPLRSNFLGEYGQV